ncbi:unnamed protein product [Macrosiphum euphorbiae]|uniref:Uncharacterized protein n=1 Tax=Macrosiphum euphorbiae TaxID=13131 RepID=A0AAV0WDK5_9HEMI|nr:unnamed protein product [Macrosiphum euphorbiae]
MVQSSYMSAMVIKLPEATPLVKVACSNWSFRCPDLVPVRPVNEHESVCRYVLEVPCLVHVCQWVGSTNTCSTCTPVLPLSLR